jgi:hypothetical protein
VTHDYVTVRSQDQRVSFYLYGDDVSKEPDAEGVSIDHIEWNRTDPGKTKVYLKKGPDVASVEISEVAQATASAAPSAVPQRGNPAIPPIVRLPNSVTPPGVNRIAPPSAVQRPPGAALSRPTLPRAGGAALPLPGMPTPGNQFRPAGPQPLPGGIQQQPPQKRIRVIPSVQQ